MALTDLSTGPALAGPGLLIARRGIETVAAEADASFVLFQSADATLDSLPGDARNVFPEGCCQRSTELRPNLALILTLKKTTRRSLRLAMFWASG